MGELDALAWALDKVYNDDAGFHCRKCGDEVLSLDGGEVTICGRCA